MREQLRDARESVPEDIDAEATLVSGDPVEPWPTWPPSPARC